MILKIITLISVVLITSPVFGMENPNEGVWVPPPPARDQGLEIPELSKGDYGVRRTPELEPQCGDRMINGDEVCDPTAFNGLLANLCRSDCLLEVTAEQFECVMNSFSPCQTEAREEINAEILENHEAEVEQVEEDQDYREQFESRQGACYQAAIQDCMDPEEEAEEIIDPPEFGLPGALSYEVSGSGCTLAQGSAGNPFQSWGWVLAFMFGLAWIGFRPGQCE